MNFSGNATLSWFGEKAAAEQQGPKHIKVWSEERSEQRLCNECRENNNKACVGEYGKKNPGLSTCPLNRDEGRWPTQSTQLKFNSLGDFQSNSSPGVFAVGNDKWRVLNFLECQIDCWRSPFDENFFVFLKPSFPISSVPSVLRHSSRRTKRLDEICSPGTFWNSHFTSPCRVAQKNPFRAEFGC